MWKNILLSYAWSYHKLNGNIVQAIIYYIDWYVEYHWSFDHCGHYKWLQGEFNYILKHMLTGCHDKFIIVSIGCREFTCSCLKNVYAP